MVLISGVVSCSKFEDWTHPCFCTGGCVCQMILYTPDHMINSLFNSEKAVNPIDAQQLFSLVMCVYQNAMQLFRELTMARATVLGLL